jgi:hypothetical protein
MQFDTYYKCYRLRNASATPECLGQSWNGHTIDLRDLIHYAGLPWRLDTHSRDCIGVAVSLRHLKRLKNKVSAVRGTVHLVSPLQSVARNGTHKWLLVSH